MMTSNTPLDPPQAVLIHEVSTALAVAKGRAQLLHRRARRMEEPIPSQFLQSLEAIDEAVMRAHAGLIAYLAREYMHQYGSGKPDYFE